MYRVVHHISPPPIPDNLTSLLENEKKRELSEGSTEKEKPEKEEKEKIDEDAKDNLSEGEFHFEEEEEEVEENEGGAREDGLDFFNTQRGRALLNAITA